MTHEAFLKWFDEKCKEHMILRHKPPFTVNELVWVLRQQPDDYSLSWSIKSKDGGWTCVPSVRECFIPAKDLGCKMEIKSYTEDEYDGVIYKNLELKLL